MLQFKITFRMIQLEVNSRPHTKRPFSPRFHEHFHFSLKSFVFSNFLLFPREIGKFIPSLFFVCAHRHARAKFLLNMGHFLKAKNQGTFQK